MLNHSFVVVFVQNQWTASKEPNLPSAVVEILVPFSAAEVLAFVRQILDRDAEVNWKFVLIFCSAAVICLEDELKLLLKGFDSSLETT